ncbi:hypothetical protein IV203_018956 [Nitzschia inconspicua]|uniref:Uncharacterized protein n=1 Tax=Nitzschia inconspicua TaxID=303405 RepID=A0A9K3P8D5_9STRA|nr:hypothetical protein IV203_018956 [Nitzschia inconspicua]
MSYLERSVHTWHKTCRQEGELQCTKSLNAKIGKDGPKAFESWTELYDAVDEYCNGEAESINEIAIKYGYPIDKWDVFQGHKHVRCFQPRYSSWEFQK